MKQIYQSLKNLIKPEIKITYQGEFLVYRKEEYRGKLVNPHKITHTAYVTPDTFVATYHWDAETLKDKEGNYIEKNGHWVNEPHHTPLGRSFIILGRNNKIKLGDLLQVTLGKYVSLPKNKHRKIGEDWYFQEIFDSRGHDTAHAPLLLDYKIITPENSIVKKIAKENEGDIFNCMSKAFLFYQMVNSIVEARMHGIFPEWIQSSNSPELTTALKEYERMLKAHLMTIETEGGLEANIDALSTIMHAEEEKNSIDDKITELEEDISLLRELRLSDDMMSCSDNIKRNE